MSQAKIFIVFYSTYLHVYQLALAVKQGLEKVKNVQVEIYQIEETLPTEVLEKMHAPPKPDIPIITPDKLQEADGILFGYPTRFGTLPAQFKHFIDACGQLWAKGALHNKMVGTFVSTATQHGGQETSTYTFLTTLAHFGLLYVPFGYSSSHLNEDTKVMGGSPWGASILAGKDGLRQASAEELEMGSVQGEQFGKTVARFVAGRQVVSSQPTTVVEPTNEVVKEETAKSTVAENTPPEVEAEDIRMANVQPPNSSTLSDKVSVVAMKGAQKATTEGAKEAYKEHKENANGDAAANKNNTKEQKTEEVSVPVAEAVSAPVAEAAGAPAAEEVPAEVNNPDAVPTGTVATEAAAEEVKNEEEPQAEGSSNVNGDKVDSTPSKDSHSTTKSSGGTIRKLFKRLTLRGKKKPEEANAN